MIWFRSLVVIAAGLFSTGPLSPPPGVVKAVPVTGGLAAAWPSGEVVTILRSPDGLFRVGATVDGHAFTMIVDTGATTSIINAETAETLGLAIYSDRPGRTMQTLAGPVRFSEGRLAQLKVGKVTMDRLEVAIMPTPDNVSVLGQDAIARLGQVTLNGDRLTIG